MKGCDTTLNVVDLPGIYSLSAFSEDEMVSRNYLLKGEADLVVKEYGPELMIPGSVITKKNVDDKKFWGNQVGK